jgi:rSAM/selenodomain-associated transferase 2
MPVLNEEKILARTFSRLELTPDEELVVVDGGSTDRTVRIAREFTGRVLESAAGRGRQMNLGARHARGDILLFLHADSILPKEGFSRIRSALGNEGTSAGAFDIKVEHTSLWFRVIETFSNLRSRLTSVPYGDQGLFMRKETFELIGGFRDVPLMEDIEIARRLKRLGRLMFVRPPVLVSPRRWLHEGLLYATLRDWAIVISYSVLKIPPERLMRYYGNVR